MGPGNLLYRQIIYQFKNRNEKIKSKRYFLYPCRKCGRRTVSVRRGQWNFIVCNICLILCPIDTEGFWFFGYWASACLNKPLWISGLCQHCRPVFKLSSSVNSSFMELFFSCVFQILNSFQSKLWDIKKRKIHQTRRNLSAR